MLLCGGFSASGLKVLVTIGVHLALVLVLVFNIVFYLQAYKQIGKEDKFDRLVLFSVMAIGSTIMLFVAVKMKPKKQKGEKML